MNLDCAGYYDDDEEAAKAYDVAVLQYASDHPNLQLNFPASSYTNIPPPNEALARRFQGLAEPNHRYTARGSANAAQKASGEGQAQGQLQMPQPTLTFQLPTLVPTGQLELQAVGGAQLAYATAAPIQLAPTGGATNVMPMTLTSGNTWRVDMPHMWGQQQPQLQGTVQVLEPLRNVESAPNPTAMLPQMALQPVAVSAPPTQGQPQAYQLLPVQPQAHGAVPVQYAMTLAQPQVATLQPQQPTMLTGVLQQPQQTAMLTAVPQQPMLLQAVPQQAQQLGQPIPAQSRLLASLQQAQTTQVMPGEQEAQSPQFVPTLQPAQPAAQVAAVQPPSVAVPPASSIPTLPVHFMTGATNHNMQPVPMQAVAVTNAASGQPWQPQPQLYWSAVPYQAGASSAPASGITAADSGGTMQAPPAGQMAGAAPVVGAVHNTSAGTIFMQQPMQAMQPMQMAIVGQYPQSFQTQPMQVPQPMQLSMLQPASFVTVSQNTHTSEPMPQLASPAQAQTSASAQSRSHEQGEAPK